MSTQDQHRTPTLQHNSRHNTHDNTHQNSERIEIYSSSANGDLFELRNWQSLSKPEDVMITSLLSPADTARVQSLRAKGLSDPEIYACLHPSLHPPQEKQSIDLSRFSASELSTLLCSLASIDPLPSLSRLTKADLAQLILAFSKERPLHFVSGCHREPKT